MIEEYILDLSPYILYQIGHRDRLSKEYNRQIAQAVLDKKLPQPCYNKAEQVGKKAASDGRGLMKTWGKVCTLYPIGPTRTIVDDTIDLLPILPENETTSFSWQHFIDNTVEMHKDPDSQCWVAFNVRGDQPISFNDDSGNYVGSTTYDVALVNSKRYHAPESDGEERLLLRKTFTKHTFEEMKSYFYERLT